MAARGQLHELLQLHETWVRRRIMAVIANEELSDESGIAAQFEAARSKFEALLTAEDKECDTLRAVLHSVQQKFAEVAALLSVRPGLQVRACQTCALLTAGGRTLR